MSKSLSISSSSREVHGTSHFKFRPSFLQLNTKVSDEGRDRIHQREEYESEWTEQKYYLLRSSFLAFWKPAMPAKALRHCVAIMAEGRWEGESLGMTAIHLWRRFPKTETPPHLVSSSAFRSEETQVSQQSSTPVCTRQTNQSQFGPLVGEVAF